MSIRRKLLLALFSALVVVGVAASVATWLTARNEADELFDYQLEQMALTLRDQTLGEPEALLEAFDYDFIVQVWDPSGGIIYLSNRAFPLPQAAEAAPELLTAEQQAELKALQGAPFAFPPSVFASSATLSTAPTPKTVFPGARRLITFRLGIRCQNSA